MDDNRLLSLLWYAQLAVGVLGLIALIAADNEALFGVCFVIAVALAAWRFVVFRRVRGSNGAPRP